MRRLVWLLALACPAVATAQQSSRCAVLIRRAFDTERPVAPREAVDRAGQARRCASSSSAPEAPRLFALEAMALAEHGRWQALVALADTFRAHGHSLETARTSSVVVLREAALAKIRVGRASEGLADLRALGPYVERLPNLFRRLEYRLALVRGYRALGDPEAALRELNAAEQRIGALPVSARAVGAALVRLARAATRNDVLENHPPADTAAYRAILQDLHDADSLARRSGAPSFLAEELAVERARALLVGNRPSAARVVLASVRPSTPVLRADVLRSQAEVAFRSRDPSQAARLLAEAERLVSLPDRVRLLTRRGAWLEAYGDWDEAARAYREALRTAEQAWQMSGSDEALLLRRSPEEGAVRGMARVLAAQGHPKEAFALHDGYRARLLALYRARAEAQTPAQSPEWASALAALQAARDSLALPDGDRHHVRIASRIQRLQGQLARLQPLPRSTPTDVSALQARLHRSQQTLVAYLLDAPLVAGGPARSLAFVVTSDTVHAVPLALTPEEAHALEMHAAPLLSGGRAARQAFDLHALHRLHQHLIAPLRLPPHTPLLVVPDGPLFALPFGMLVTQPVGRFALDDARFLLEDRAVSVEIAAAQQLSPHARAATDSLLVMARTDYARARLPDLLNVEHEVRRLRRWPFAFVATNADAVEAAFRRRAPRARFVHLAAHTDVQARSPMDYAFRLWPEGESNGRLTVADLLHTPLRADLVVLSGCSTAQGETLPDEGMLGLQYGVRAAGARSVLATLWMADDAATAVLTQRFYDGVRQGLRRDEALRQAQLAVLHAPDGRRRSPYLWAAPVLYGDAGPLDVSPDPMRFGGIVAASIALAVAGALAFRLTRRRHARHPRPLRRDQDPRHRTTQPRVEKH
ncbi:MAG: CHAT domain-containing protein [Bacteroidetes bacterium]|nr:CHAT domain-containing protein [Bacteroidota bacterium]